MFRLQFYLRGNKEIFFPWNSPSFRSIALSSLHYISLLVFPSALNLKIVDKLLFCAFLSQFHHSSMVGLGSQDGVFIPYTHSGCLMQMDIFPYSVFYIFFEQYLDIWRIALINIAIALGGYF